MNTLNFVDFRWIFPKQNILGLPECLIHGSKPGTIPLAAMIDARFACGLALALASSEKNMTRWAGKSYLKWCLTGEHNG